jgi:hypothetical protein
VLRDRQLHPTGNVGAGLLKDGDLRPEAMENGLQAAVAGAFDETAMERPVDFEKSGGRGEPLGGALSAGDEPGYVVELRQRLVEFAVVEGGGGRP